MVKTKKLNEVSGLTQEIVTYPKSLTPKEVTEMKSSLSDQLIKLSRLENESDKSKTAWKAKIDPVKAQIKILVDHIRDKSRDVSEKCYKSINRINGNVDFINLDGVIVKERELTDEERQLTIGEGKD